MSWASRTFAPRSTTSIALAPRPRAALARSDPDRRPTPVHGRALGEGAGAWPGQTGRGRSAQALARPLRSGDRTAAVPAPSRPNVLHLDLPLMRVDEAAVTTAADAWRASICRLAATTGRAARGRPDQALRVRPDGRQAPDRRMPARHRGRGGTLYVTTSRRTPAAVIEAIAAALPPGLACTAGCRRR